MRPVVLTRVLESEALGLLEIELDRGALPLAADGVVELDVDFRSVERPPTLVDAVRGATVLAPARARAPPGPRSRRCPVSSRGASPGQAGRRARRSSRAPAPRYRAAGKSPARSGPRAGRCGRRPS